MSTLKKYARITGTPVATKTCLHPEDKRIDARSMGHWDRYICGVCGARLGDWSN